MLHYETVIESGRYRPQGRRSSEIAESVEAGVRDGHLRRGEALPPVRSLAEMLGVSPATVAAAYRTLRERGVVATDGRRGTKVAARPPVATLRQAPPASSPHQRGLASGNPDPLLLPALLPALSRGDRRRRLYGEPTNRADLVERAEAAFAADGVAPGPVAVVSGGLDGMERVLQAHLRHGDRVAVEDPAYPGVLDLLRALGLVALPVGVDDDGPSVEGLERALRSSAAAVVLTPRAQNPTGAAVSERRARELRRVLRAFPGPLVVEDDHAGPVAGAPAATVAGRRQSWAVVRSVSKWLGPDLRLAVLTGDPTTVARVEGRQALASGWVSHVLQAAVVHLWSDPRVERLLGRAADAYAERRLALVEALAAEGIPAHGRSGLNVWVPVPEEAGVVQRLGDAGWAVRAGERFRLASPPAVRITTATLFPAEARRLAADLARALSPAGNTAPA